MKTIEDMPEHGRPGEKLREKGPSALTDEELVAAILGMGSAGVDVRTIARQVRMLENDSHNANKRIRDAAKEAIGSFRKGPFSVGGAGEDPGEEFDVEEDQKNQRESMLS